jgi:hypothetical protein
MEAKILGEIQKHYKHDVIDFDWEPVRKKPKGYGVLYPIIGYIISSLAIRFMVLGVFMWLLLVVGGILSFGGVLCANGIITEYTEYKKIGKTLQKG